MRLEKSPEADRCLPRRVGGFILSGLDWLGFVVGAVMLIWDGVRLVGASIAWIVGLFVSFFDW